MLDLSLSRMLRILLTSNQLSIQAYREYFAFSAPKIDARFKIDTMLDYIQALEAFFFLSEMLCEIFGRSTAQISRAPRMIRIT